MEAWNGSRKSLAAAMTFGVSVLGSSGRRPCDGRIWNPPLRKKVSHNENGNYSYYPRQLLYPRREETRAESSFSSRSVCRPFSPFRLRTLSYSERGRTTIENKNTINLKKTECTSALGFQPYLIRNKCFSGLCPMCVPRSARVGEDRIVDPTPKAYKRTSRGRKRG